jgi:hypothetical protein
MELEKSKTEWEIKVLEERYEEKRLKNAEARKDVLPFDTFRMAIGAFGSGLRTNLLRLPERIARGNEELREIIDSEVQSGIEQTIEYAIREIESYVDARVAEIAGTDSEEGSDDDD